MENFIVNEICMPYAYPTTRLQYGRKYRRKNRKRLRLADKQRYPNRRKILLSKSKARYKKVGHLKRAYMVGYHVKNKVKRRAYHKKWLAKNPGYSTEYTLSRMRRDFNFKLRHLSRNRINSALQRGIKSESTEALIGCDIAKLRQHLESLFQKGMSWRNHGKWHIDHKRPCASFDLTDLSQHKQCFHFTNLQPLWAKENLVKGARYAG